MAAHLPSGHEFKRHPGCNYLKPWKGGSKGPETFSREIVSRKFPDSKKNTLEISNL
jgi:hypothetical protein